MLDFGELLARAWAEPCPAAPCAASDCRGQRAEASAAQSARRKVILVYKIAHISRLAAFLDSASG